MLRKKVAECIRVMALSTALTAAALMSPTSLAGNSVDAAKHHATGETAWRVAVRRNLGAQLHQMLPIWRAAKQSVDLPARDGKTALMAAAALGDIDLLNRLIIAGANPLTRNKKGASALLYAAWRGDRAVVQRLINLNVPIDQAATNGWTAMTMASAKGKIDAIRLLLRAGARVDARDVYGWTPLMRASDLGRANVVRVLVAEGEAQLGAVNAGGQSALHVSAAADQRAVYQLLVSLGGDVNKPDFRGRTPAGITRLRKAGNG